MPGPDDVIAIVPAYRPGADLAEKTRRLREQTGGVIVVDDGSGVEHASALAACAAAGAVVVAGQENLGIAHALNAGIAKARSAFPSFRFILTLDQDSELPDGYVDAMATAYAAAIADGHDVGMVAPERVGDLPPVRSKRIGSTLVSGEPIQSGLLIPVAVLDQVGGFREDLFIDGVDTEFYIRCRSAGMVVAVAPGTRLPHRLGEREAVRLFGVPVKVGGRPVTIVRSALFRYYYLARNRALINRAFGAGHRAWCIRETLLDLRHFAVVLALLPHRRERFRLIRAGWRDARRGKGGRIPGDV